MVGRPQRRSLVDAGDGGKVRAGQGRDRRELAYVREGPSLNPDPRTIGVGYGRGAG